MNLKEYFYTDFYEEMEIQIATQQWRQIVDEILKQFIKFLDSHHTEHPNLVGDGINVELEYMKKELLE